MRAEPHSGPATIPPEDQSELMRRRWTVLAVSTVGVFIGSLNSGIVSVAVPVIAPHFGLGFTGALWIQTSYLLVLSILLIPLGHLADRYGLIRFHLIGVGLFIVISVAAALSPNGTALIAARGFQGGAAALVYATGAAIVVSVFPAHERGFGLGLNVAGVYVGVAAGPPLGGLIVAGLGWQWVFLINIPISLALLVAGWTLVGSEKRDKVTRDKVRALAGRGQRSIGLNEVLGTGLLAALLAAFFLPLTLSAIWGWGNPLTIGLLCLALILGVFFVILQQRVEDPLIDIGLLRRNRGYAAANLASFLYASGSFGVTIFTAIFLEVAQGRSPEMTGLVLLVPPVLMVFITPVVGRLSDRIGPRPPGFVGLMLVVAGMALLGTLPAGASLGRISMALILIGAGTGLFSAPNMSAIMGSVDESRLSSTSGFVSTTRFCGQALSIGLLGAIAASTLGPTGAKLIWGMGADVSNSSSLVRGYHLAMLVGAGLALIAALASLVKGQENEEVFQEA